MVASVTSSVSDQQKDQDEQDQHPDEAGAAQLTAALSPKQRIALNALLLPDASVPDAAKKAGVHRGTVNRWLLEDENFIAVYNARQLELITLGHARMLALVPKAMKTIEDALDMGDARVALQMVKNGLFSERKTPAVSSQAIAREREVAEQQQQVKLQKKQVELEEQKEQAFARKKAVGLVRFRREQDAKPFLQRYEDTRRFYHTGMIQGPITQARMDEIDARVAAEVKRTVNGLMNPGAEPRQTTTKSPEAGGGAANPGAASKSGSVEKREG